MLYKQRACVEGITIRALFHIALSRNYIRITFKIMVNVNNKLSNHFNTNIYFMETRLYY